MKVSQFVSACAIVLTVWLGVSFSRQVPMESYLSKNAFSMMDMRATQVAEAEGVSGAEAAQKAIITAKN